ncbi:hypothetical protein [uncultured Brevundimonas sp.]|uniref:hypothetical protein n=1 Tax=uncultured Brevundimonas sp. TaxID=213418 RepID=UPI00262F528E|nr:hypothetical protein [uncultured Brevundimonas sp.]
MARWLKRLALRIWALFVGVAAAGALLDSQWLFACALMLHAIMVWPDVGDWFRFRGMRGVHIALILISIFLTALLALSARPQSTGTIPTDSKATSVAPAQTQDQTGQTTGPISRSPEPRSQVSLAAKAGTDDVKLARLILIGRRTMSSTLRDPASATYRNVRLMSMPGTSGALFCGEVNARNGFGGYTGYRRFIVVPGVQAWTDEMDGFSTTWADVCRSSRVVRSVAAF